MKLWLINRILRTLYLLCPASRCEVSLLALQVIGKEGRRARRRTGLKETAA